MLRFCSSVAFFAMLTYACASKHNEDTVGGTGGDLGFGFGTGGSTGAGGAGNGGAITAGSGLSDLTQEQFDKITSDACSGWSSEGENSPALIDFVVDTSGSMSDNSANTGGQTKWAITAQALQNAIDVLPSMTVVGMLLWPNMNTIPNHNDINGGPVLDTSACVNTGAIVPPVALGPTGSDQRAWLSSAIGSVTPAGGTPMADAYNYALGAVMQTTFVGAHYMVLITDGQPTIQLGCMGTGEEAHPVDFGPVTQSITNAYAAPNYIQTFVIGSPGSEAQSSTNVDGRDLLSAAARAGGTATPGCSDTGPQYCHFDMSQVADFATGFTQSLQTITGQILSCDFKIPDAPGGQVISADPTKLNVIYKINGSSVLGSMKLVAPSDPTCPQGNGWYLDPNDPANNHVILCANTCDLVHKDAGAVLDFRGGCDTISIVN